MLGVEMVVACMLLFCFVPVRLQFVLEMHHNVLCYILDPQPLQHASLVFVAAPQAEQNLLLQTFWRSQCFGIQGVKFCIFLFI